MPSLGQIWTTVGFVWFCSLVIDIETKQIISNLPGHRRNSTAWRPLPICQSPVTGTFMKIKTSETEYRRPLAHQKPVPYSKPHDFLTLATKFMQNNRDVISICVNLFDFSFKKRTKLAFPVNSCFSSWSASGARKAGVPTVFVSRMSSPWNSLLTPKSAICTQKNINDDHRIPIKRIAREESQRYGSDESLKVRRNLCVKNN